MQDLRIGVIGVGGRGGLARDAHHPGEGSRLVAGADVSPEALGNFKEFAGEEAFVTKDYKALLAREDIDAVFVTSPDFLHEEQAVAALRAGKAVYLEKPMSISVEGCDRILAAAFETGSKLFVGHNMRHFPVVLKMKELIDSGAIGEVQAAWCRHFISYGGDAYFKDWHSERRLSSSLLLQKGAHDIDVLHWLAGGFSKRVVGMGMLSVYNRCADRRLPDEVGTGPWNADHWPPLSQKKISPVVDVEDHSMLLMQLDNGAQCSYLQCHYTPDAGRNYTFIGTEGRIENEGDWGLCQVKVYNQRSDAHDQPDAVHHVKPVPGTHGGADPRVVAEFIRFVREGAATKTCPVAARNAVAAGLLGAESIRAGSEPRDVPPLSQRILDYFAKGQCG